MPQTLNLLTHPGLTEIVLNVLLHSFRFSPSKKADEIVWNVAAVRYPTVGKKSMKAELPLKVEVL